MPNLPSATTTLDDTAGALATGLDVLTIIAAVGTAADTTPRLFTSTKALLTKHNYFPAADFLSMFFDETKKPAIVVGVPIATAGVIGRIDASGNSGGSVVSAAAAAGGILEAVDLELTVGDDDGTVGTDNIGLILSLDGGRTTKKVRLGTASSYTIPYVGIVLSFGAGTLVAGDLAYKCSTTAPRWDQAGLAAARTALAAQSKLSRSWLIDGDLVDNDDADDILTEVNGYETSDTRFIYARAQARDRRVQAAMSRVTVRMTGAPTITFAEVGATGDTITRSAGSFIADGFAVGDVITVSGAVASAGANNVTGPIASLTALVITLGTTDLVSEGPISNVAIVGSNGLTFAEVGATGDTLTRTGGSWLDDGFAVGDVVTITGTVSNNVSGAITAVTATVMTFGSTDLAAEVIGSRTATITAGEEDSDWAASIDDEFEDIDDEKRLDIGAGRARKLSPITGYRFRRPVQWAATIREYQHDVQIPTWRKEDGPLSGWTLEDEEGNTVEHDERIDGNLLSPRFTCFRSWANGPSGAFIALSLTRALEASLLSRTHNMAVANVAQSVCQAETENAIGQVVQLNSNDTGKESSLSVIEERVNSALQVALLQRRSEGPRASSASWTASREDVLNVTDAELTGTLSLGLNGTIEKITTRVRIRTAG